MNTETGMPSSAGNEEPNDPDGSAASSTARRRIAEAPENPLTPLLQRRSFVVAGICALLILVFGRGGPKQALLDFLRDDLKAPVDQLNAAEPVGHFLNTMLDCARKGQQDCSASLPEAIVRVPWALVETAGWAIGEGIVTTFAILVPVILFFVLFGAALRRTSLEKALVLLINPFTYLWLVIMPILFILAFKLLLILLVLAAEQLIIACAVIAPIALYAYDWVKRVDGWKALSDWIHSLFEPFLSKPA